VSGRIGSGRERDTGGRRQSAEPGREQNAGADQRSAENLKDVADRDPVLELLTPETTLRTRPSVLAKPV
jgi:hypothetical protein